MIRDTLAALAHLFYPHLCPGCSNDLPGNDSLLCLRCINDLPHTGYAPHPGNPAEKIFWGRLPIRSAHSEFYFEKEALIQRLMHQLKYKGNTCIGTYLGELMGRSLLQSERFSHTDALIPLPLFPAKEHRRGYNQAAVICKGMSAVMQVPVITNNVVRRRSTQTQTRKHRTERWENVEGSFAVTHAAELNGRHLLLVDDVLTTGATLEACGKAILDTAQVQLSIATLAMAGK